MLGRLQRDYRESQKTIMELSMTLAKQSQSQVPVVECSKWKYVQPKLLSISTRLLLGYDPSKCNMRPLQRIVKKKNLSAVH